MNLTTEKLTALQNKAQYPLNDDKQMQPYNNIASIRTSNKNVAKKQENVIHNQQGKKKLVNRNRPRDDKDIGLKKSIEVLLQIYSKH